MQNVGKSDNKKLVSGEKKKFSSSSSSGKMVTPLNKFSTPPANLDLEQQHRVIESSENSESDEESVSEVDSFPLDQGDLEEIPDSCSDSCDNEVEDNDEDDDEEESDEDDEEDDEDDDDDIVPGTPELDVIGVDGKFLLDDQQSDIDTDQVQTKARLEALLEAAANINPDKLPVIRRATLALDEAAQTLTKMRTDSNSREKNSLSRSLIAACNDNDVNAVRRLLGEGNSTINEATDDGDSLLSLACSAGYYELAQVLLAMSAQVEDRGQKNDCTPLMEAASAGHVDIIRLLITHGADVNAQSSTGNTPLMYACVGGHVTAVKALLAHEANIEDHNENGHTPLMEAASAGHVEVAKILLEHGAGINTHSNEFKESALTLACYKGHLDMVRFLLEAGADQEHKTDEMHTALMEASMDGHVEVARLLLDSGAQVNMPTDSFESPLTLAACGGHVDLAMLLIERGANIEEVNDEGYTPLMEAAREGHEEMVALLLSQGANINAQTEETQETALTLACCGGFLEVADYLIKNGAKIELGASTPLMEAAQEGHIDLVKFLLENGAHVHAQTQTGDTALTYACENGHTDVAEVLLYYNAELEHESEGGRTPLMKACRAGHICTVKFLIGKGADVNRQTSNNDHTPLSLACAGGHQAVVELLLKSGADPFHKLKDNSTMLIEAAKGGHIGVVQLLLDYPHSMANNGIVNNALSPNNAAALVQQTQQHQFMLAQQQQQLQQQHQQLQLKQAQLGQAPPGLHEVPEAVRVSNQQVFHQQPMQPSLKDNNLDQNIQQQIISNPQLVATPTGNIILDSNSVRSPQGLAVAQAQQPESILTQMRLLQMHHGFSDGLAHGLARAQPSVVNQMVNTAITSPATSTNSNNNNTIIVQQNNINTNQSIPSTSVNKQKSLLRHKSRQGQSSFEPNLTTSEAQQVRSQPVGEDENPIYLTTNQICEELEQHKKKLLQEYHQKLDYPLPKANIQLICDSSGPPTTLLPSTAYVDITTPGQGLICGPNGITFSSPNGTPLGQIPTGVPMQSTALANFVTGGKPSDNSFMLGASSLPSTSIVQQAAATCSPTTISQSQLNIQASPPSSTHISAPSEVSQNTAISDRPKVKPVSKKDGKNTRKAAAVLQQNQMVSIYNNLPPVPSSDLQILQQSLANLNLQTQNNNINHQSLQGLNTASQIQQQPLPLMMSQNNQTITGTSSKQQQQQQNLYSLTSLNQNLNIVNSQHQQQQQLPMLLSEQEEQQFGQMPSSSNLNQKMLQMVATIPNHPLQKIAQRLCSDQPKSPSESPPSDLMPSSPNKNISSSTSDLADISRIFCEVMQSAAHPTAQDFVQVHQHVSQQNKNNIGNPQFILQQQHLKLNTNQQQQGNFIGENDDQLHMFTVEDHDAETMAECGIYPALDDSLEQFTTDDSGNVSAVVATGDVSREPCNYEWVDNIDEVLNVLHGFSDLPEMAANLTCHDFEAYSNLIGMNSICKTRWSGQWQGESPCPPSSTLSLDEQQRQQHLQNAVTIDHQQLQQQLQQQLSVEQLQLLSHLQNQHNASLSIIPTSAIEQHLQTPNTFTLTSLPAHLTSQCQTTNIAAASSSSPTSATITDVTQAAIVAQQQQQQQLQQLQLQQQQTNTLLDAQQQAKLVFNVETDKSSPPLQLLFQLPPTQQGQSQQQSQPNNLTPQQQQQIQMSAASANQTIAQTQTGLQMQQNIALPSNLMHQQQNNINLQQQSVISQPNATTPHCNFHSQQVQVATQTQQQQISNGALVNVASNVLAQTQMSQQQNQQQIMDAGVSGGVGLPQMAIKSSGLSSDRLNKIKGTEKSRKDKNRYPSMRQAPAGQQQQVAVSQFPLAGGVATIPQEKTIDVDSETDSNHDTALTLACAGGHEELVELLITRGASIEHRDKKGFTPLILAATAGHEKVVETLLKHGAELEAQSERTKDTPLSLACSGGRYEVVELLLNVGANKEHRNVSDYTPLSLAASGGYVNIIKLLLSHGAEINSRTGSKLGISPLMLAAMNGHTAAVKLLLDMGSDINAQIETNRNTALTLACFQGRHEVVSLLLDRKANVEHRAKTGLTPLMEAASGGYIEVGRVLLDKAADVNATPVPSSRDTALTIAADKGHIKFVELLLSRGAAVEVKNKKGNSPLWLAANGGHLQVVEVLYNSAADIDSQDNRKVSCLMAAFRKGHTKVVKWMVNHVTQFPSDQEMTRYISTVSDKELLEKCHECVKIIRSAKEAQAVKANKNASILLEELDMEKTREESRRAAAARRRERKKKKKLEKKEKRKQIEAYNKDGDDKDDDDDDEDEDDSDKEDDRPSPLREEGDSGFDANSRHSSCSSANNDQVVPPPPQPSSNNKTTAQTEKTSNKKSKKKKNNQNNKEAARQNSKSPSDNNVIIPPETSKKKDEQPPHNNNNKTANNKQTLKNVPEVSVAAIETATVTVIITPQNNQESKSNQNLNNNKQVNQKEVETVAVATTNKNVNYNKNNKNYEKENILPNQKAASSSSSSSASSSKSSIVAASIPVSKPHNNISIESSSTNTTNVSSSNNNNNANNNSNNINRKSLVFNSHDYESSFMNCFNSNSTSVPNTSSSSHQQKNNNVKKSYHHDISGGDTKNTISPKQIGGGNGNNKREEGWKEVVRKSSIQQQTVTAATTTTITPPVEQQGCKKVQVSTHAISRVIGRAGSNINAIRAATGAHIEVEKQGKAQGDRCITIKGSPEATKQASILIGTLIKDPDVDILTMLPRPNLKPSVPTGTSIWEKSTSVIQSPSTSVASSTSNTSKSITKPTTMINSSQNITKPSLTTNTTSSVVSGATKLAPALALSAPSRPQQSNPKNIFTPSSAASNNIQQPQQRQASNTGQLNNPTNNKRMITTTSNITSNSNTSKSTVSYTNSLMALKSTIQNKGGNPPGSSSTTFASKLSTDNSSMTVNNNNKKGGQVSGFSTSSSSVTIPSSPSKHHIPSGVQNIGGGLPAPFTSNSGNNLVTSSQSGNVVVGSNQSVTKPPFSQNQNNQQQSDSSSNITTSNHRSITPIGPPSTASRNVTPSPLLQMATSNIPSVPLSMNSNSVIMQQQQHQQQQTPTLQQQQQQQQHAAVGIVSQLQKINQLQHGNAQAHEYSLFNDSYSSQWEQAKQYGAVNQMTKQFIENVPPLQVDASKAPGYRGNAVSSPVSTKGSINTTTPPGQTSGGNQSNNMLTPQLVAGSNVGMGQMQQTSQQGNQGPIHSVGDIGKPLNQSVNQQNSQLLQSGGVNTSGLAVQRPVQSTMNNATNQMRQQQQQQMDAFGMSVGNNVRQNLFDTIPSSGSQNMASQMMYGQQQQQQDQQMQQMYHAHMPPSRLNPRASAFSSMHQQQSGIGGGVGNIQQQTNKAPGGGGMINQQQQQQQHQNFGNIFHQNGNNNYQKMPPSVQSYNAAPGPPPRSNQSQGVIGVNNNNNNNNARWFGSELGHLSAQRELLGMENGLVGKGMGGSPAMSPNNSQQGMVNGGVISNVQQQAMAAALQQQQQDDGRKPRPIGTERASWKHFGGGNDEMPNWIMDNKQHQQQQAIQPAWIPHTMPRNHFVDDMQPQHDHFQQWQMEYNMNQHIGGPNQSNVNLMQSIQYANFTAPNELTAQLPDKIEQWVEPEKQGWQSKWTF